ncbi:amidohydrolase [Chromatiales bacterium (ex Bugula neritina AB1)]|nr:amidohydrolase [Chromatiales bacterium (ex Bugula neritina AB1)]
MADIVILNGRLITFDGADAEALAITNGQIEAVGSTRQIRDSAGSAHVIDAAGATVLPGFIDSHVHLFGGSAELDYLNLTGVYGLDALTDAVREYAATRPDDPIIFGVSIDYRVIGNRDTTRHDLDAVLPDRPFAAMAADHHTVWANTKALEKAGLLHGAPMPDGSEVVLAGDGKATGELRETGAFGPIMALTPLGGRDLLGYVTGKNPETAATLAERTLDKSVIARGLRHCASYGITGLHNMDGNFYQMELLAELESERSLLCRTEVPMHLKGNDPLDRLLEAEQMRQRYATDYLWSGRVKMFMDGVIDSRTAYMLEPYPGTNSRSEALFTPEQFNEACVRADAKGLQIAVHAIGDAAVRQTLDGYQAAVNANGPRDSRHRIEHIEVIHADDIPRISALGAVASMQPLHSPAGGLFPPYVAGELLHDSQISTAFAWKTIRESGAKLIFSTDWPVVPVDVMLSIKGAVAGTALPPEWPDQRQNLRQALASYTRDNAWVEFNENRKGKLKTGMMADIVVMDHNLEAMPPEELHTAKAAVTICGGNITYQR